MQIKKQREIVPEIYNSIESQLSSLQNMYSKILPIRIDFSYKKISHTFRQNSLDVAMEDITVFMSIALFRTEIVGYFWVLEHTRDSGLHFHAVFYLSGQSHRNTYPTAMELIKIWEDQTNGDGRSYLIPRNASYFHVDALQILKHGDVMQKRDLLIALSYLAKADQKDIGLYSGMSPVGIPSGRGRPRKNS